MISKSHVIKGSCDYGKETLIVSNDLAKFSGRRHCGNEDMMVLVCHKIL